MQLLPGSGADAHGEYQRMLQHSTTLAAGVSTCPEAFLGVIPLAPLGCSIFKSWCVFVPGGGGAVLCSSVCNPGARL